MNEFDLIERIRCRIGDGSGVVLGIGDDAAVLQPSAGMQLVASTDSLVAGRHFIDSGPARARPEEIGHLALAVNLSDLAAMGALPRWCLLALTLPEADQSWLDGFLDGFLALATTHEVSLVGGNLARGPLNIGVTVLGEVEAGRAVTRGGAQPGDRIVVTGTLGDAAAALAAGCRPGHPLRARLLQPVPRIAAGRALAASARAMIDISDGLAADLAHLLGSHGARLETARLPASPALIEAVPDREQRAGLQLAGGGDYELLALVPPGTNLPPAAGDVTLSEIGQVTTSGRIELMTADGRVSPAGAAGWDHFGA